MTSLTLPAPTMHSVNIPFAGFYESIWSQAIDSEENSWIDHVAEEPSRFSPAIQAAAEAGELGDCLWQATDGSAQYDHLARAYVEEFADWLCGTLGMDGDGFAYRWDGMVSPKFYNFTTDRLFMCLSEQVLHELYRQVMLVDASWAFDGTVKEMFTSYDGFASFYDNDPAALKDKPLADWDENELKVLLVAWCLIQLGPDESINDVLYERLYEEAYAAFEAGVDWEKLEELAQQHLPEDYEDDTPYRCPHTLELPL